MISEPDSATSAQRAWRDAVLAFCVVGALVTGLVRININLPWIGHLGSALVSVLFLYVPLQIAARRGEDLRDYGLRYEPVGRGLATAGIAIAVIVPLFALGFFAFYEVACKSELLSHLAPHRMCSHYGGLATLHLPAIAAFEPTPPLRGTLSAEWCLVQWLVVGLPEELFFRGFMFSGLLKWGFWPAAALSALMFALVHFDPGSLLPFFGIGVLMAWLYWRRGSLWDAIAFHFLFNALSFSILVAIS